MAVSMSLSMVMVDQNLIVTSCFKNRDKFLLDEPVESSVYLCTDLTIYLLRTLYEIFIYYGAYCSNSSLCASFNQLNSQVVTLRFNSELVSVLCQMGDFGCGAGPWTPIMKTDGNQVRHEVCNQYVSAQSISEGYIRCEFVCLPLPSIKVFKFRESWP